MRRRNFEELGQADRLLIEDARRCAVNAYAPYSGFAVGSAVRTRSKRIHHGANLENAAYGLGMCAEVAAITAANSAGDYDIEAIAVVGFKFSAPPDAAQVVTPCGRCRQLIFEAGQIARTDPVVFSCSGDLKHIEEAHISEMLPGAFGPDNLGLSQSWPQLRDQLVDTVRQIEAASAPSAGRAVKL